MTRQHRSIQKYVICFREGQMGCLQIKYNIPEHTSPALSLWRLLKLAHTDVSCEMS